jgi:pilus assembly protein CpaB
MRARSVLLLAVALGCGLVASIGITQVMARRGAGQSNKDLTPIFVAQEDIPMGDPISPQLLQQEEWPKDKIPPSALAKIEDIENRRPKSIIFKGSPILDNQLWPKGNNAGGAQPYIPKGYKVVAVKVDDVSALGGILRPGDRVDVLVYMQSDPAHGVLRTEVRTFLQDVKVFGINEVYEPDTASGDKKLSNARTVELLLTPRQAQAATLASEMGKIRLSLRSLEVDDQPPPPGTDIMQLFSNQPDKADRNKEAGLSALPEDIQKAIAEAQHAKPSPPPPPPTPTPPTSTPPTSVGSDPPKSSDEWKMTLIGGSEVNHLTLEPESDPNGPPALQSWRVNGLPSSHGKSGSAPASSPSLLPFPTAPNADKGKPGTGNNASPDGNNPVSQPAKMQKVS